MWMTSFYGYWLVSMIIIIITINVTIVIVRTVTVINVADLVRCSLMLRRH